MAVAMIIMPILITFLFLFAGVLSPPSQLPSFWRVCLLAVHSFHYSFILFYLFYFKYFINIYVSVVDVPIEPLPLLHGGSDRNSNGSPHHRVQQRRSPSFPSTSRSNLRPVSPSFPALPFLSSYIIIVYYFFDLLEDMQQISSVMQQDT